MKTSKYKGVSYTVALSGSKSQIKSNTRWRAYCIIGGKTWFKVCDSERECAIAYDLYLISLGREPVNILKKK